MRRLLHRLFSRHDERDINCIRWDYGRMARNAECPVCLLNGGYAELVRAANDTRPTSPGEVSQ